LTCLRAGIIIGSGSASFEIMRDLVEKLPVMITPKWLLTKCQPIGIMDVQRFLIESMLNEKTYNRNFDIGSEDVLSYKEMLLIFAEIRSLKRKILTVPVMTPRLSSYWLYFVTSTSYKLARSLVDRMKVKVVCRNNKILNITPISYRQAIINAFDKIENNEIISSWKDSHSSSDLNINISDLLWFLLLDVLKTPEQGILRTMDQQLKRYGLLGVKMDGTMLIGFGGFVVF
jgi:hypothetical protein